MTSYLPVAFHTRSAFFEVETLNHCVATKPLFDMQQRLLHLQVLAHLGEHPRVDMTFFRMDGEGVGGEYQCIEGGVVAKYHPRNCG